ncbi:MAG: hypothetical protein KatS3mg099_169 [Candidatus Parcubacteria bacterium]|nr:MAG: hypothetical protein KatS3mg099_169 [Candidatus Parcubacteria bacterium]
MRATARGMTLIDALIGVALIAVVFVGLAGVFRLSLVMVTLNKMRVGAVALASERMEVILGMEYNTIGTVGGIPPGPLEPTETIERNGTTYTRRTLVVYTDDPADGLGGDDHNGITTDYKRVKVEVTWQYRDRTLSYAQVASVIPPGIESSVGGGTLRIKIVDAAVAPLPGITVRVENETTDPPIATEIFSNPDGEVILGGAPAASNYHIVVSKDGYSSDGTLAPSADIPTPLQPLLTVEEGLTTAATFAVDRLANLAIHTWRAPTSTAFLDPISDTAHFASWSNVQIADGALSLVVGAATGTATTTPLAPTPLESWLQFSWGASSSAPVRVQLWHEENGTLSLVPEEELPGNAAGFTASPIDLQSVATTTASGLVARFDFVRNGEGVSPELDWWRVAYRLGPAPLGGVTVRATSSKILGYDAANQPVPKHIIATTTNSEGERLAGGIEWDAYAVGVDGWRVADVCPALPLLVAPGGTTKLDLFLEEDAGGSLRVVVVDENGAAISGATATLSRASWSAQRTTSTCGNAFFGDVSAGTYTLEVQKTGYTPSTSEVEVDGEETASVTLLTGS